MLRTRAARVKLGGALSVLVSLFCASSASWGATCFCGGFAYSCFPGVGTCNPNSILASSVKCDWKCDSVGNCPDFNVQCPGIACDLDGDGKCTICGGGSSDTISGTPGDDVICARGGADIVIADQGGNDIISGDDGSDVIQGGSGNDYIYGGSAGDCLAGGGGSDTIDGGTGDDGIFSQCVPLLGSSCTITTGDEDDILGSRLCGAGGADLLVAHSGKTGVHCLDGGKNQDGTAIVFQDPNPPNCGWTLPSVDCQYIEVSPQNQHDSAAFRNCQQTLPFGSVTVLPVDTCGCFPP